MINVTYPYWELPVFKLIINCVIMEKIVSGSLKK